MTPLDEFLRRFENRLVLIDATEARDSGKSKGKTAAPRQKSRFSPDDADFLKKAAFYGVDDVFT